MKEWTIGKKVMLKLVSAQFRYVEELKGKKWYHTWAEWLIDSKFRRTKRLDKFLSDQLDNPGEKVIALAKKLKRKNPDSTIISILTYVRRNIIYKYDKDNFGKLEYWAEAKETLKKRSDDCDGLNGLIYILARLAGIPYFMIYSVVGLTVTEGHYWCVYYSTKEDKLVAIDATYDVTLASLSARKPFVLGPKYAKISYLFNDKHIFKVK